MNAKRPNNFPNHYTHKLRNEGNGREKAQEKALERQRNLNSISSKQHLSSMRGDSIAFTLLTCAVDMGKGTFWRFSKTKRQLKKGGRIASPMAASGLNDFWPDLRKLSNPSAKFLAHQNSWTSHESILQHGSGNAPFCDALGITES